MRLDASVLCLSSALQFIVLGQTKPVADTSSVDFERYQLSPV